jgi:hypothetical protein
VHAVANHPNRSKIKAYPFAVMLNDKLDKAFKTREAAVEYFNDQKAFWAFDKTMNFEFVDRSAS